MSDHPYVWSPDGPECHLCGSVHMEPDQRRQRREQRLRDLGFEELTQDQLAWNRLINLGIGDKP